MDVIVETGMENSDFVFISHLTHLYQHSEHISHNVRPAYAADFEGGGSLPIKGLAQNKLKNKQTKKHSILKLLLRNNKERVQTLETHEKFSVEH